MLYGEADMSVVRKNMLAAGEASGARGDLMRAIVQDRFGPPDTLQLVDAERPEIGSGDVLLAVHAAAVNPYDWHMVRGDPRIARLMGVGLTKPKARIAGVDVAGRVQDVGADVSDIRPGDEVFGFARGAFAEFAAADAALVVPKPAALTFQQAAAMPMAAVTALHAIRDLGQVQSGQRVLVNGAAGGVGTIAVQLAAALGAEVTGVCSAGNVDLVRSIGATRVIDYAADDFADGTVRYDLILDNVGNRSIRDLRRAVSPSGILLVNGGGSPGHVIGAVGGVLRAAIVNRFVRQQITFVPTTQNRDDLLAVTELVENGSLGPVIDRTYPLVDTADALRYVEAGHARGKVVIAVT
jgi:NADPH:quinone reductase-like Zn-dependent oxidoreductase